VLALEWHPVARDDLLSIVDNISDDNPDAAQLLKDEIETKTARLCEFPELYRTGRVAGTREMVVRSNYVVVYVFDATAVTILRVLHAARKWPPAGEEENSDQVS
jgi:toxin ParE1/3/4